MYICHGKDEFEGLEYQEDETTCDSLNVMALRAVSAFLAKTDTCTVVRVW